VATEILCSWCAEQQQQLCEQHLHAMNILSKAIGTLICIKFQFQLYETQLFYHVSTFRKNHQVVE